MPYGNTNKNPCLRLNNAARSSALNLWPTKRGGTSQAELWLAHTSHQKLSWASVFEFVFSATLKPGWIQHHIYIYTCVHVLVVIRCMGVPASFLKSDQGTYSWRWNMLETCRCRFPALLSLLGMALLECPIRCIPTAKYSPTIAWSVRTMIGQRNMFLTLFSNLAPLEIHAKRTGF